MWCPGFKKLSGSIRPVHHCLNFLQVRYGHKCVHTLKLCGGVLVKLDITWNCVVRFVSSQLYFWEDIPMPNVRCECVCLCVCVCVCVCMFCNVWVFWKYVYCTMTEVFPCFFLSCNANYRIKLAKTKHGPHSSRLVVICVVLLLFVLFYVLFVSIVLFYVLFVCKCVLY